MVGGAVWWPFHPESQRPLFPSLSALLKCVSLLDALAQ